MRTFLITIIVIVLVVLFGTWPLTILAKVFDWLSIAIKWLANILDVFGWNGFI